MGEFGFLTADGVYHVTVYATDENGNFRVLSMKNLRRMEASFMKQLMASVRQQKSLDVLTTPQPFKVISTAAPKHQEEVEARTTPTSTTTTTITTTTTSRPPLAIASCSNCKILEPPKLAVPMKEVQLPNIGVGGAGGGGSFTGATRLGNDVRNGGNENRPAHPANNVRMGINVRVEEHQQEHRQQKGLKSEEPEAKLNRPQNANEGLNYPPNKPEPFNVVPNLNQSNKVHTNGDSHTEHPAPSSQLHAPTPIRSGNTAFNPDPNTHNPSPLSNVRQNENLSRSGPSQSSSMGDILEGLLYKFNYTVGYHGHNEVGDRSGNKDGEYYSVGSDGIRRSVTYKADASGFHPVIKFERVSEQETPLPSDKEPGLKGYEFKWFYMN